jgi:hypothetical protein
MSVRAMIERDADLVEQSNAVSSILRSDSSERIGARSRLIHTA